MVVVVLVMSASCVVRDSTAFCTTLGAWETSICWSCVSAACRPVTAASRWGIAALNASRLIWSPLLRSFAGSSAAPAATRSTNAPWVRSLLAAATAPRARGVWPITGSLAASRTSGSWEAESAVSVSVCAAISSSWACAGSPEVRAGRIAERSDLAALSAWADW